MLYATGLTEEDMKKPQVGVCSVWYEGNPCNMHLLELSEYVKQGVQSSDCVGFRFNTIGVSVSVSFVWLSVFLLQMALQGGGTKTCNTFVQRSITIYIIGLIPNNNSCLLLSALLFLC